MSLIPSGLVGEVFSWRVTVDSLLIGMVLFFAYRTLLRLGTWKIFSGVMIAMAVFAMANILDLRGIRWAYSNLSQVALIALIVIFQPEIRKVFERAASLRHKGAGGGGGGLAAILADAAFELASQRRGAIIVLPGRETVEPCLAGGMTLNADPSVPLLLSIFDPHSPGHDGAVVVENGALTRFGVRLPLSKTSAISDAFGTRHHASLGLVECTDALVITVSEERGSVTLFHGGQAAAAGTREYLAARILSHWSESGSALAVPQTEAGRRRFFVEAGLSLAAAFVFVSSLTVSQGEVVERGYVLPVEFLTPKTLALVGDKPSDIKVHLSGPKSEIEPLNPALLAVRVDLQQAKPGRVNYVVSRENIKLPKSVQLVDVEPSSLPLHLAELVEREIPIKPQLVGRPAQDVRVTAVEVTPGKLKISLPADDRNRLTALLTTPVYLEGIEEETAYVAKILAPAGAQPVDKRWPDVEVRIKVVRK